MGSSLRGMVCLAIVIRMGDGTLRYRASRIEEFIDERERLTNLRRRRG